MFLKLLLFSLILIIKSNSWAFQVTTEGNLRSFPFGGYLSAAANTDYIFWGQKGEDASKLKSHLFGYLSSSIYWDTAISFNSLGVDVGFYPVSLLGIKVGKAFTKNTTDYSAYDCERFNCTGEYGRDYLEIEIKFGYQRLFYLGSYKSDQFHGYKNLTNYIDSDSGLIMESASESLDKTSHLLGYKYDELWIGSLLIKNFKAENTSSNQTTLNISKILKSGDRLTGGIGSYSRTGNLSDIEKKGSLAIVNYSKSFSF